MSKKVLTRRMERRIVFGCRLTIGGVLLLSAAAGGAQAKPDPAAATRGQGIYSATCSFCHGARATGTEQAPNLLRSPLLLQDKNGDVLGSFLKHGRPAQGMPSFASLPASQVTDIAAFLHARLGESHSKRLPESAMVVGNAEAGRAFFDGQGKCSSCHSPTSDLAGIGSKLQPLALTSAFLTPPDQPLKVRVTLPSGESITGALKYEDEFAVGLTDASGTYHSWYRSSLRSVEITDPLTAHEQMLPHYTDDEIHNLLAYLVTLK